MSTPEVCTLYSGSKGNCTFVRTNSARILIDAGKSARSLCNALSSIGSDISEIDAVFITHEHTDHISALEVICKKHPIPIHMTARSASKLSVCGYVNALRCVVPHETLFSEAVGDIKVSSFRTPHDSLMSVGYRMDIQDGENTRSIGLATDIGYVTKDICDALTGCDAVILESNHDIDMLKGGSYPYDLKKRILSNRGHLSNKDSAAFAAHLAANGTRSLLLAHLSEENNTPSLALAEHTCALADENVTLAVASPDAPTMLIF